MQRLLSLASSVAIVTLVFGTIYTTVQQDLRISANDPQIQMAEDSAVQIKSGQDPTSLIKTSVDVSSSLSPFLIFYDANGNVIASSAQLDGKTPELPVGVFKDTTLDHESRFTWQPQADVRLAAVVVKVADPHPGFVLSGRSLREVEKRVDHTLLMTAAAWALALIFLLIKFGSESYKKSK